MAAEWIPVVAAAFAVSFLLTTFFSYRDTGYLRICGGVMLAQVLVGLLGGWMHLQADLQAPSKSLHDRIVHGAPIFAPLLFADIAILALLGLWRLRASASEGLAVRQVRHSNQTLSSNSSMLTSGIP